MANHFATAEVAQAAEGAVHRLPGLQPVFSGASICAPAATCACAPADNLALHRLLRHAPRGAVLVCAVHGNCEGGYFGELMALEARNRGLVGLIIDGSIRDSGELAALEFPVFYLTTEPASCQKKTPGSVGGPVVIAGVEVSPGDQVVADRDAVLIVPRQAWSGVAAGADSVRAREAVIRRALMRGKPLAELLSLPPEL